MKGNVLVCVRAPELLQKAKIDNICNVCMVSNAYRNITWFQITMYEVARMNVL